MSLLISGGAGYIGSHVAIALTDRGEDVVVVDDLSTGRRDLVPSEATFVKGSIGDRALLDRVFEDHDVEAVLHFAAKTIVPESVEQPLEYWQTNTLFAHELLGAAVDHGVEQFLYSSTAAVYGIPDEIPVREEAAGGPINPYGSSKYAFERMLFEAGDARLVRPAALRYFNVAGADPDLRTGQATPQATHLIKVAVQAALGQRPHLEIYGTDWNTPDGTCVRDYIHVSDLAALHLLALDKLRTGDEVGAFNCGYGRGYSVREVVDTVLEVCGDFEVRDAPRRAGDPPALVADTRRLREMFDWEPQHDALEHIVETAWRWEATL